MFDHAVLIGVPLVGAGLLYVERGGTYTFKHALIQDAAYASLLRTTRQQYHRRIAQTMADLFPLTVETAPELLAHHYTQAGMVAEAVPCWLRAGQSRACCSGTQYRAWCSATPSRRCLRGF